MPVDPSVIQDRQMRARQQLGLERVAQANIMAAVGDKAQVLSLGEEWRVWEEHVRVLLAEDEKSLAALREHLEQPDIGGDDLHRVRSRLFVVLGRLEARRQDLDLPAELTKRGQEAGKQFLTSGQGAGTE